MSVKSTGTTFGNDGKIRFRVVLELTPIVNVENRLRQDIDKIRALFAASLIWLLSGTPVQIIGIGGDAWFVLGLLLQLLICVRSEVRSAWAGVPLACAALLYSCWAAVASTVGIPGQFIGLSGQIIKISIVLLPMIFVTGFRIGLVRSMAIICKIALIIFGIRQLVLMAGFDIANLFQPLYDFTGIANDRTIFLFNFDIPEEAGRNSGPFREPGMFAANIVIATLLLLSLKDELTFPKIRQLLILFGVTLLTTMSTMGLATVPFLGLWALPFFIQRPAIRLLMVPCLIIAGIGLITVGGREQIEKVQQQIGRVETQDNRWYSSRFGNAYIDYAAILDRPLLGYGFSEEGRPNLLNIRDDVREAGLGNGLTGTIVKHGLVFSISLYILFLLCGFRLYGSILLGLVSWLVFGIILFSQQLLLMPAAFTLIGYYNDRRRIARQTALPGSEDRVSLTQDGAA